MEADPADYLARCDVIDHGHAAIRALAAQIADNERSQKAIVQRCFRWVRDQIRHSGDDRAGPVTCAASEVLRHRTGYCYAKSHLLAALLRANQIPAGLCYQRLSVDGVGAPFCLHGLNAVYLDRIGWYRVDARGNKPGVDAQFTPPREQLAFNPVLAGENDLPDIYPVPLPIVLESLRSRTDWEDLANHLPDVDS